MESVAPVFVKDSDLHSENMVSEYELCSEVAKQIGSENLIGGQRIKGLWRIYIKTEVSRLKLITERLTFKNITVDVYSENPFRARLNSPDEKVTKITVKDIPLSRGNSSLERYFEAQGVKLKGPIQYAQARDPITKTLSDWLNSDRIVYAEELKSPLPRFINIGTTAARIFYEGQSAAPKLCTKCFSKEHTRGQCKEQQACRRCRKPGHEPGDARCEASVSTPLQSTTAFSGKKDELSNFFPCEINIYGKNCKSAEHAYQYAKAVHQGQLQAAEEILQAPDAYQAKAQARSLQYSKEWQNTKQPVMKEILDAHAQQVPEFHDKLLDTDDNILVEATFDRFWGSGLDKVDTVYTKRRFWPGKNHLGSILEDIQKDILSENFVQPKHHGGRKSQRPQGPVTRSTATYTQMDNSDGFESC